MANRNNENNAQKNRLEWGKHNPKLTDLNFIDRIPKKSHHSSSSPVKTTATLGNGSFKH